MPARARLGLLRRAFCRDADSSECAACGLQVISTSFHVTLLGLLLKSVVGYLSGSHALMADALHSVADSAAFGLNRFGAQKHAAARYWFSMVMGIITFVSGVWIFADSVAVIIIGEYSHPGILGCVVAGFSVLVNFHLYRVSACASGKCQSQAVTLCMIQNRTNCYAACMAFLGTVLADLGVMVCDPAFAILIGFFLFMGAFEIFGEALAQTPQQGSSAKPALVIVLVVLSCLIIGIICNRALNRDNVILVPAEGGSPESQVDSVLGRAHYFVIYDATHNQLKPVYNTYRFVKGDVSEHLVKLLIVEKVNVVLSHQIGPEMFADLNGAGARIYYVDHPQTVRQALANYQQKRFPRATASNVARGFGRSGMQWLSPW
jgi:predicted Fe-Mo cluster-binding NifX family protein